MKFSVFTASTPDWTPQEVVHNLAAQGWDGVEWRIVDQRPADSPSFWAGNRATWPMTGVENLADEIASLTAAAGLEISAIGGYARCERSDDVLRLLKLTARLGADRVRVSSPLLGTSSMDGGTPSGRSYREAFAAGRRAYREIAIQAADLGVKALIEMHPETVTASASASLRFLDGLDPAAVGVIYDVGNLVVEGYEDYLAGLQLLGPYLAHVHVKNARVVPDGLVEHGTYAGATRWREESVPFRDGQADFEKFFAALASVDYDGWVTSEDFSTVVPLAERTADNLAYLKAAASASRSGR